MQQLVFQLLGPPEIFHKGQPVKIPRRRSRALLYYLVSTQLPQPRERLLTLLCGDVHEESARNTFKTLLAEVRSFLRGVDAALEWIINDGDLLKLNPRAPLWLDTEIFEKVAAGASRNLNQAIDLYRGAFLDGFYLKDAPDFDTWVRSSRDHFQHLYLQALQRLAEAYEAESQVEQAIACTQMLLTTDALSEEAYARLMRLYWMAGDRIEALRQYEHLCAILTRELAVKPSSSTQALYEQIARQGTQPVSFTLSPLPPAQQESENLSSTPFPAPNQPLTAARTPCIGRQAEVEWLSHHLTNTNQHSSLLLLQGEIGIGKTRLIQEIHDRFDASYLILQGTCHEVEQIHSYHAIVDALRQGLTREEVSQLHLPGVWLAQLVQLLPDHFHTASLMPEHVTIEPLILADALAALFNEMARPQRPLLLILDDLHWADATTLALLGHLTLHTHHGSVFLLGTYCKALANESLEPLRRSISRHKALDELTLPPLNETAIKQLTALSLNGTHLASLPTVEREALIHRCYQRSEGNPSFAYAWLSLALKEPELASRLSDTAIPEAIVTLVKQQLASISREARALLTAAAFLGSSFNPLTAAHLLSLSDPAAITASDELLQKGIITETLSAGDDHYTFTQRTVRNVILVSTSTAQRRHFQHALQEL